jgi:very-short-patch-repair endonuclease
MEVSTTVKSSRQKMNQENRYMERVGLKTLRFSDKEIFENLSGVLEEIWKRA